MINVQIDHFARAALEIGHFGENDTLPYDVDAAFIKDKAADLAQIAFELFQSIDQMPVGDAKGFVSGLIVGAERLLVPAGSQGFRITTKIHPFWNMYLNGIGLAVAEANEGNRSARAHSYRLGTDNPAFFDKTKSWRSL